MIDTWEITTSLATAVAAGGTVWASLSAARAARAARDTAMAMIRPFVVVRKGSPPSGGHRTAEGDYEDRQYNFEVKNVGPGPAVLGPKFWDGASKGPVVETWHQGRRDVLGPSELSPGERFFVPDRDLPNVLGPDEAFFVLVVIGYHMKPMENPFCFDVLYSDAEGRHYMATIGIVPDTGDVVSIVTTPR